MSDHATSTARQRDPRDPNERLDGIQKLTGTVSFHASDVSISVSIPANHGSLTGTSELEFAGSPGSSVQSNATEVSPTVNALTGGLSAAGLDAGNAQDQYTVKLTYMLNGKAAAALSGSVASPSTGTKNIVLQ